MTLYCNKFIAIVGPTASGKSDLALRLARKYDGAIICADSRQVYKYMNIGTNKPTRSERRLVPYYGLDLVAPDQTYTLADFLEYAHKTLNLVWKKGQLPFIVGGTGLYVTALVEGYGLSGDKPNAALRKRLEIMTTAQLAARLKRLSKPASQSIDLKNRRRLIRAIELIKTSNDVSRPSNLPRYQSLQLGLKVDREKLYKDINRRVDQMIKRGLIAEVKRLTKRYNRSLPAMSGIGYKQIGQWLRDETSYDQAVDLIKRDTRHYAKRQMTWFRQRPNIHWIDNTLKATALCRRFIKE